MGRFAIEQKFVFLAGGNGFFLCANEEDLGGIIYKGSLYHLLTEDPYCSSRVRWAVEFRDRNGFGMDKDMKPQYGKMP